MISVTDALAKCLALVAPLETETVPLAQSAGRVLRGDVAADRPQPPFAASAMDGYAILSADHEIGKTLKVIGESAAGHGWDGTVTAGTALRIFTGAPMPRGADRVVLQEDVTRNGDLIILGERIEQGTNVRPAGADFPAGFTLRAPRRLGPSDLALLAAMNCGQVPVSRRPVVAIIATGDELVMPGESLRDDQIVASNCFALKAMVQSAGAEARLLPIAPDRPEALRATLELASGADLIVTIGGASVGDHDLVAQVAGDLGLDRAFYKIAMRPGKPLMAGRLGTSVFLGLPGNPVSAIVCGHLFLLPMLRAMLGLDQVAPIEHSARLSAPLPANGPRAHYMRAVVEHTPDGDLVTAFDRQDSSLLTILTEANCLLVCPPNAPPLATGQSVTILPLQAHY